ncbi:hypothetical protein BDN67DRAFT_863674, partial [Paxillus ammoniavirescens]
VISHLGLCDVLEETLQSEWTAQVVTQTRPAPRQSKQKADEEISKIIELEKLVDAHAQMVLRSHAEASVKHREPTLLRLVTTYNELYDKLMALIQQRKVVHGAVMLHYIPREGLFELDVDDDI